MCELVGYRQQILGVGLPAETSTGIPYLRVSRLRSSWDINSSRSFHIFAVKKPWTLTGSTFHKSGFLPGGARSHSNVHFESPFIPSLLLNQGIVFVNNIRMTESFYYSTAPVMVGCPLLGYRLGNNLGCNPLSRRTRGILYRPTIETKNYLGYVVDTARQAVAISGITKVPCQRDIFRINQHPQ